MHLLCSVLLFVGCDYRKTTIGVELYPALPSTWQRQARTRCSSPRTTDMGHRKQLQALALFFHVYGAFHWDTTAVTLWGPIQIADVTRARQKAKSMEGLWASSSESEKGKPGSEYANTKPQKVLGAVAGPSFLGDYADPFARATEQAYKYPPLLPAKVVREYAMHYKRMGGKNKKGGKGADAEQNLPHANAQHRRGGAGGSSTSSSGSSSSGSGFSAGSRRSTVSATALGVEESKRDSSGWLDGAIKREGEKERDGRGKMRRR